MNPSGNHFWDTQNSSLCIVNTVGLIKQSGQRAQTEWESSVHNTITGKIIIELIYIRAVSTFTYAPIGALFCLLHKYDLLYIICKTNEFTI